MPVSCSMCLGGDHMYHKSNIRVHKALWLPIGGPWRHGGLNPSPKGVRLFSRHKTPPSSYLKSQQKQLTSLGNRTSLRFFFFFNANDSVGPEIPTSLKMLEVLSLMIFTCELAKFSLPPLLKCKHPWERSCIQGLPSPPPYRRREVFWGLERGYRP